MTSSLFKNIHPPYLRRTNNELYAYSKLIQDYQTTNSDYDTTLIKTVINNESSHFLTQLKESKLMTESTDFLTQYYSIQETKRRYTALVNYYITYSKIFPNYNALREGKYFFMNIQRKQQMINVQEKQKTEMKLKQRSIIIDSAIASSHHEEGLELFNTDIYESIVNDTNKEDIDLLFGASRDDKDDIENIQKIVNDIEAHSERIQSINILPSKTILRFVNCHCNISKSLSKRKIERKINNSNLKCNLIDQYNKERTMFINSDMKGLNKSLEHIRQRNNNNNNNGNNNSNCNKGSSLMNLNFGISSNLKRASSIRQSNQQFINQNYNHQLMNRTKMVFSRNINKINKSPLDYRLLSPHDMIEKENSNNDNKNNKDKEIRHKEFKYIATRTDKCKGFMNKVFKQSNDNSQDKDREKRKSLANSKRIIYIKPLSSFNNDIINHYNNKVSFNHEKRNGNEMNKKTNDNSLINTIHNGIEYLFQMRSSSSMSFLLK